jgi:hypothetical protein
MKFGDIMLSAAISIILTMIFVAAFTGGNPDLAYKPGHSVGGLGSFW